MGRAADRIFTRIFVFLIMTVYFWILTVAGLIVLGIGPAFRTMSEMYMDNEWDYKKYSFKTAWSRFKTDFWQANWHTWIFLGTGIVLAYNLYLSTTVNQAWMLFVQFIIVAALIFDFSLAMFTTMIRSRYDVTFKDAVKLAVVQFFSSFMQLLVFIVVTITMIVISLKWPGLIIFLSPGIYMFATDILSHQWYAKIDKMLEAV